MGTVLTNAILVDLDPPNVEPGSLRIDGSRIVSRGAVEPGPSDQTINCQDCAVLPGLVNGHTHLYSALAVGMPPPPSAPKDFREILELIWWRLDRTLDADAIELSARAGAVAAIRSGTTTLIDHHASPGFIDGALDCVERGAQDTGVRVVQCYETTDRQGPDGARAGVAENRRYLQKCRAAGGERFGGLVGAHASFTLEQDTLTELAALADEWDTGVHIHVAEDTCDVRDALDRFDRPLIEHLAAAGALRPQSLLAHGTHLDAAAWPVLEVDRPTIAHNPRSNMNNAVGYAPVDAFPCPVVLGTDGIGGDMFTEARFAWFKARETKSRLAPDDILGMLAASARFASGVLGVTLGRLATDAAADVIITDYRPPTPMTAENLFGHLVFGMGAHCVKDVMVAGDWAMRNRAITCVDERELRQRAREKTLSLWQRMASMPT